MQAGTQRAVDRAHFQADDPAAQNQHAFGHFFQLQRAGAVHNTWVVRYEGPTHGLAAGGDDAPLERDYLFDAGLLFAVASGLCQHQKVIFLMFNAVIKW